MKASCVLRAFPLLSANDVKTLKKSERLPFTVS